MSPSGRDPTASLRLLGTAVLTAEALVLLLALPVAGQSGSRTAAKVAVLAALAVAALGLAARFRRRWVLPAALGLQVPVLAAGFLAWPLFPLGVIFAGLLVALQRLRGGLPDAR